MDVSFVIATFIASAIAYSVSLLLGTLGELITERAGHLNLGVEGMMLMGGACGYLAAVRSQNIFLVLLASLLGSGFCASIYAFLTVTLRANQNVTGLALTVFGTGLANTLGNLAANTNTPSNIDALFQIKPFSLGNTQVPVLRFFNISFLSHNIYVYIAIILSFIGAWFLFKTKAGLHLRMIGENPGAADASGIHVTKLKYIYIIVGGMICGLAGLYIPLVLQKTWHANITAGKGWIVVALVIFVRWHPLKAIVGSFIFGALSIIGLTVQQFPQVASWTIFNAQLMNMYPYILTVMVLIVTYAKKSAWKGPSSIGQAYFREER